MPRSLRTSDYFRVFSFCFLIIFGVSALQAQALYIGDDSVFYLANGAVFTTSDNAVEVAGNGDFFVEAGSTWGNDLEYVNGSLTALGSGTTKLPVGNNGVYAPVNANHSGDVTAEYFNEPPAAGSNGQGVDAVGDTEFWELSGNAIITLPWNSNSGIDQLVNDNGGVFNSISIVGLNNGNWELVSASQTYTLQGDVNEGDVTSDPNESIDLNGFGQFTFGIDTETVLSVEDVLFSSGFSLLSNPVGLGETEIRFSSKQEFNNLEINVFDLNGRLVRTYNSVETYNGVGQVSKGNLQSGLYFVKFEDEGKTGVKKMLVE
ncbi:MAG: T9SS type A sorting domain-containing protein [Lutimonas sp.]